MCVSDMVLGDKGEFAIEFSFEPDPDVGAFESHEMAASWGRWALWVKNRNLCRHTVFGGESSECVSWYLLPVLEWFCDNWISLFSEQKPATAPLKESSSENAHSMCLEYMKQRFFDAMNYKTDEKWFKWRLRHSLRSCREGGLFPDVFIRGHGENVDVKRQWKYRGGRFPLPERRKISVFLNLTAWHWSTEKEPP